MTINTNVNPYFDDYNESKGFYKILFNPGVAVQTRELTQLQTAIQNQITKFGDHVFQHGTVVLGGERFYESNLISIKMDSSYLGIDTDVSVYLSVVITGVTSGTQALVKQFSTYKSVNDPKTLIVKITSGTAFIAGELISYSLNSNQIFAKIQAANSFSTAKIFSINDGVFYVNGYFVKSIAQSIVVESFTDDLNSKSIGFNIVESIINSDMDESLLDQSQGSPNFSAPGADRYNIALNLVSTVIGTSNNSYIELAQVVNGQLKNVNVLTLYSELEKELARRTYDESGNYTIRPFPLTFISHIGTAKVRPVITSGSITSYVITDSGNAYTSVPTITIVGDGFGATAIVVVDNNSASATYQQVIGITPVTSGSGYTLENTVINVSGDSNKFTAALDPGKAYVKGFEFETTSQSYLSMDKARTTESANSLDVPLVYGNFLFVDTLYGVFDTSAFIPVELHNVIGTSVTDSTLLGVAKVRFLKYSSGIVGTSTAQYRMSLFDITLNSGKLFASVKSIVVRSATSLTAGANVTSSVNINLQSKLGASITGDVFLTGSDSTSLVFHLNHQYVKALRDTVGNPQNDYTFTRVFNNVSFSSGQATISSNSGLEIFQGGSGALADTTKDSYYTVVVTSQGTSTFAVGTVLRFNSPSTITGGTIVPNTPHQLTLNINASVGFTATIIATINANTQSEKIKNLQPYTTAIISTPATVIGGKNSLLTADVFVGLKVYNTGNQNPAGQITLNSTTGTVTSFGTLSNVRDVSTDYTVDNGQRDEYYDHGSIQLKSNAPQSTDYLVVIFNYFTHTGNGFFGVGSYSIPYEQIPNYVSPTSGKILNLADSIDYRPRRNDNDPTFSTAQLPDPDFSFNTSYQYYVGRIDIITATSSKNFAVIKGIPSTTPKVPADDSNSMDLYIVEIPPYTISFSDLSIKFVENKRYTMRDIGTLERRIENIEYYTQLTLLEKQAKDSSIIDGSNLEKFKNGFFVDPFTSNDALFNTDSQSNWSKQTWGWWNFRNSGQNTWNKGVSRVYSSSVSDSSNIDYHASVDPFKGQLRAEFLADFQQFGVESLVNAVRTGDLITLPYSEVNYINQPFASSSININPYNVIAFTGNMKLDPPSDIWVDTSILPVVNKIVNVQVPDGTPIVNDIGKVFRFTKFFRFGGGFDSGFGGHFNQDYINLAKLQSSTSTTSTNIISQNTSSLGSDVVDIQYIPYIRARKLIGICNQFKPNARLYPFVEKELISIYCKPVTSIVVRNHSGILFDTNTGEYETIQFKTGGINGIVVATAQAVLYSSPLITTPTDRILSIINLVGTIPTGSNVFVVGQRSNNASIISANIYNLGDPLTPDVFGNLAFEFNIPSSKFKTGERTVRLIDNIDNIDVNSQSIGEAKYFALGSTQTKEETLLTTRVSQNQTITKNVFKYIPPSDPLAQSFFISGQTFPNGAHVTSFDIFFKSKSLTVPVKLELRKMINGYPESGTSSIPFAVKSLDPENINISSNGSVATNFKLDSSIHLLPGEYAIVIMSNSNSYEVFVAELGRTNLISNQVISQQPSLGVLFKSQNASTWTPVQELDLKFNLNIAQFSTSGTINFGILDYPSTSKSGISTLASGIITGVITSGLNIGDYVYGIGVPASTQIQSIGINTITLDNNVSVAGTIILSAISLIQYQTLHINTANITPIGTSLSFAVKLLDKSSGLMDSNYNMITQNIDADVFSPKLLVPRIENNNLPSIMIQATLSSTNGNLSPAIDVSALSSIFAKNIINMTDISSVDGEEVSKGGNAKARYISKKVTLATGFDSSNIVVTLLAYKPVGTDVRVYYKTLPLERTTPFENEPWVRMTPTASVYSGNISDFKEIQYYPKNAFGNYGVPVNNPISPRFNTYAIKIVLVSSNEAVTPLVSNLRAIATDS